MPEDGDSYIQPEDENYENESVRQLETELQMEEYLKQKLQDEAFQVQGAAASLPLHSPPQLGPSPSLTMQAFLPVSLLLFQNILIVFLSPCIPYSDVLNVS